MGYWCNHIIICHEIVVPNIYSEDPPDINNKYVYLYKRKDTNKNLIKYIRHKCLTIKFTGFSISNTRTSVATMNSKFMRPQLSL